MRVDLSWECGGWVDWGRVTGYGLLGKYISVSISCNPNSDTEIKAQIQIQIQMGEEDTREIREVVFCIVVVWSDTEFERLGTGDSYVGIMYESIA